MHAAGADANLRETGARIAANSNRRPVRACGRLLGRLGTPDGFYPPRLTVSEYCADMQELSDMCCRWDTDPVSGNAAAVAQRAHLARAYADVLGMEPEFRRHPD